MAISNIVLNDAQATPVAHTFVPKGKDTKGVVWWEDQSGPAQIAYNKLSFELVQPPPVKPGDSSQERVNRVRIGVHTPKPETLGNSANGLIPAPTIGYIPRCNIEFIISERSNLQDRKDLRKYVDFLLAEAQLTALVETLLLPF